MVGLRKSPRISVAAILGVVALSACVDLESQLRDQTNRTSASECANEGCFFVNSPVKTLPQAVRIPGRAAPFFPTANALAFVDNDNTRWTAPKFTLTDGASIPRLFQPFVGDALTPSFRNAAALHDAYCGIGNELLPEYHADRWQKVHRMFYDTLVVGGTPKPKAKVMFAAVWLGGPRWYQNKQPDNRLASVPDDIKIEAFLQTKSYIEHRNPDLPDLIDFLSWREAWMQAQVNDQRAGTGTQDSAPQPVPKPEDDKGTDDKAGAGNAGTGSDIGPIGVKDGMSCAKMNDPACKSGTTQ